MAATAKEKRKLPALRVAQWMKAWDEAEFDPAAHRRKPKPWFFLFSISAVELRSLCGITRREARRGQARAADLGVQRAHETERSDEIARFIRYGYPWSTLSEAKRKSAEFHDLRKPGWLPTAIVINILEPGDVRRGEQVNADDLATIESDAEGHRLVLPYTDWSKEWQPKHTAPFEVIDGQHRLWAFEKDDDRAFELPVVGFLGLDISWQAYLFWTVNIKPKRINPSLAFDLYPLLRGEDWLDKAEGHAVYRETRSQELVETLWSHPKSPWYDRINMLGERASPWVTQAAWIRGLMATLVRSWEGRGSLIGGLFGSRLPDGQEVLGWSRAQQAAFLIAAWAAFRDAVYETRSKWAIDLRGADQYDRNSDPAFFGEFSLISSDQGVRGFLHVLNDIFYLAASKWTLDKWRVERDAPAGDLASVTTALDSLARHATSERISAISERLSSFDWRGSSAPRLTEVERRQKLIFRGSSGYKELRRELLEHLRNRNNEIGIIAARVLDEVR